MTHEEMYLKTLKKMAQFMRDYPPAEMPNDPDEIYLYVNTATDPKGNRFIMHFLGEVLKEDKE